MLIEIDSNSGFCYGVTKTVQIAEEALGEGTPVYCLGEIVHNEEEVERLKSKGLVIITKGDLENLKGSKVLLRAHGEPPTTYDTISKHSNVLYDGTCPIVLHLQKKIRKASEDMDLVNGQVVIYGKKGHAEVVGLAGQTNNEAIIVSNKSDLEQIDFSRPVTIFAQTTQSMEGYQDIIDEIRNRMNEASSNMEPSLQVTDSICRHVSKRGGHLVDFAKKHDIIIFVSGTNSSNGKVLFEICRANNSKSFWVPSAGEVKKEWFVNAKTVGICGATSTPQWLMEDIAKKISDLTTNS
jgi:4-hydroxy-3-methylbut-2-enyl diphosphate reductase